MTKKFTREEHLATGVRIARLRHELIALSSEIGIAYGTSSKVTKAAYKALDGAEQLRNLLDDELSRETTQDEWTKEHLARVYYGADERMKAEDNAIAESEKEARTSE